MFQVEPDDDPEAVESNDAAGVNDNMLMHIAKGLAALRDAPQLTFEQPMIITKPRAGDPVDKVHLFRVPVRA